jgi:hypothetical protein
MPFTGLHLWNMFMYVALSSGVSGGKMDERDLGNEVPVFSVEKGI